MCRSHRAVSPVVATVILVAVAITISIGAAYWIGGTSSQYTILEKMQIDSVYCSMDTTVNNSRWMIVLSIRNSGASPCTIQYVFLNEKQVDEYNVSAGGSLSSVDMIGTSIPLEGLCLESGETATEYIWIGSGLLSSGTTVLVRLQSSTNMNYIEQVKLI